MGGEPGACHTYTLPGSQYTVWMGLDTFFSLFLSHSGAEYRYVDESGLEEHIDSKHTQASATKKKEEVTDEHENNGTPTKREEERKHSEDGAHHKSLTFHPNDGML